LVQEAKFLVFYGILDNVSHKNKYTKGKQKINMYINASMKNFIDDLGAKKSMPGGGSAAAYAASMGNSLAMMVANFTSGKKKYIQYEGDIQRILKQGQDMSVQVMELVDKDIEYYLPLAAAYKMPSETQEEKDVKEKEIQKCLRLAAKVPMDILEVSVKILDFHEELLKKGSVMLLSDVGVGVEMVRAAAKSAYLNIKINTKYMDDKTCANDIMDKYTSMLDSIDTRCSEIYDRVVEGL